MLAVLAAAGFGKAGAQCGDVQLPYSEDFDTYGVNGATKPTCWTRVDSLINGAGVYPNLFSSSVGNHIAVLNLNGQAPSGTTGTISIATPHIAQPLNALELSFDVYKSGLRVYLATDLAQQSTYVLVGSYSPGYVWTTYEVRTDTVTGAPATGGYLVFAGNASSTYGQYCNANVDNLTVTVLNACNRTEFVRVDGITPTTAHVAWPTVSGAQGYRVSYSSTNSLTGALTQDVQANHIDLMALDPDTTYYVWVQTICGPGSLSDPRTTTFTTQSACYPITGLTQVASNSTSAAFQWSFDGRGYNATGVHTILHDLTDNTVNDYEEPASGMTYHFVAGLDPTHEYEITFRTLCDIDTSNGITVPVVLHHCGETELASAASDYWKDYPISAAYGYSYSQTMYPASAFFDMDTIRGLAVRRNMTMGYAGAITRSVSVYMANNATGSYTGAVSNAGHTAVFSGSHTFAGAEWDTLMFTSPFVYDGTSNVIVTFYDNTASGTLSTAPAWSNHASTWETYYTFNDNTAINLATPNASHHQAQAADMRFVGDCAANTSCEAPVAAVTQTDTASAELEWTGGYGSQWVVEYRTTGSTTWTVADTTTSNSTVINGLQPSTHYEARVGVLCGGETRYTLPVALTTGCALMHLPFHFSQTDLVAAVDNGFTDCWSFSEYTYKGRLTLSHRGYVRNAGNDQWLMLPAVAEPIAGARLRTWAGSSDQGWFKVGIASQANCSDVVWIDTVEVPATNPNTTTAEYVSYLDSYTGTGSRVVISPIVNNDFHYIYFFDFHLEPIEGCRPPAHLVLDSADANSLAVSWTPVGAASQWAVSVDGTQVGTTNTPGYTITGLNPYTHYNVSVKAVCDDSNSRAVEADFLTDCEGGSCYFTIHAHSATGDGWNGARLDVMSGSLRITRFTMLRGRSESQQYLVCDSMPLTFNWHSGNADEVCSFVIVGASGDTVYSTLTGEGLDSAFFVTDTLCAVHNGGGNNDDPGDDPDPHQGIATATLAQVNIAPNPASHTATIGGLPERATVSLVDMNGREVYSTTCRSRSLTIDVAAMAKGAYFVRIVSGEGTAIRKLIVR